MRVDSSEAGLASGYPVDGAAGASIDRGGVFVWYRPTQWLTVEQVAACRALLDEHERRRCDRFAFLRDRRDYAAAHALLRVTLARYGRLAADAYRFETGTHGKPAIAREQLSDRPLTFNLSHTEGLVACVVTSGTDVGVDVERVGRVTDARSVAERYFSAAEAQALNCIAESVRETTFIELWTLKEAFIKGHGRGLTCPLDSFGFSFEEYDRLRFHSTTEPPCAWEFLLVSPVPQYRLSVAVRRTESRNTLRVTLSNLDGSADGRARVLRRTNGIRLEGDEASRAAAAGRNRTIFTGAR